MSAPGPGPARPESATTGARLGLALAVSAVVVIVGLGLAVWIDASTDRGPDDPVTLDQFKELSRQGRREYDLWREARKRGDLEAQRQHFERAKDLLERAKHVGAELFGDMIHGYTKYDERRSQVDGMLHDLAKDADAGDVGG